MLHVFCQLITRFVCFLILLTFCVLFLLIYIVLIQSLLDICAYLQNRKESVESAKLVAASNPYEDMNSVVVNMLLNFTRYSILCPSKQYFPNICNTFFSMVFSCSGSRFPGSLNVDMSELSTNMVPFPKLNFLSCGLAPLGFSTSHILPVWVSLV